MTLINGGSVVAPVVICICISYSMTSLAITRYKEFYGYSPWCHESSIAAMIGLIFGGAVKFFTGSAVEFDNDIFFYVVLPPIIFSAGMSLKKKMFFRYFSLITLFGVFGTVINFCLITAVAYYATRMFDFRDNIFDHPVNLSWEHAMFLAAVLSGTDEVSALSLMPMKEYPRLGALIFGEGVLNDAISIVLFHVLITNHAVDDPSQPAPIRELASKLIIEVTIEVFWSCLIGAGCGLANARLLKSLTYLREHPIHQTVLLLLFAYLAYTIAESVDVSGILTLFVAAVTQGHYSWHSLSKPAQVATKINTVALSDIAEGFAFSYVGLSMWAYIDDGFHIQFSMFILVVVIASRFVTVTALCYICSKSCRGFKMPLSEQIAFTLGGVVRGCLCWAQILQINQHKMLVTTTLIIVMTTSLAGGFLLPILIPRLGLESASDASTGRTGGDAERGRERGEGGGVKRESLLKRSYKKHPKYHSLKNLAYVEKDRDRDRDRDRGRRKLSVYCFNGHADAEDDLYGSPGSTSPRSASSPARTPSALSTSTSRSRSLHNSRITDMIRTALGGLSGKMRSLDSYEERKARSTFQNVLDPSPRDPRPSHSNENKNTINIEEEYDEEHTEHSLRLSKEHSSSPKCWNDADADRNRNTAMHDELHGYQGKYGSSCKSVKSVHGVKCNNTDSDNLQRSPLRIENEPIYRSRSSEKVKSDVDESRDSPYSKRTGDPHSSPHPCPFPSSFPSPYGAPSSPSKTTMSEKQRCVSEEDSAEQNSSPKNAVGKYKEYSRRHNENQNSRNVLDPQRAAFPCALIATVGNTATSFSTFNTSTTSTSASCTTTMTTFPSSSSATSTSRDRQEGRDVGEKDNDINDSTNRKNDRNSNKNNDKDNYGNGNDGGTEYSRCTSDHAGNSKTANDGDDDNTLNCNFNNNNNSSSNTNSKCSSSSSKSKSAVRPTAGLEHRATSNWGDHNRYRKVETMYREYRHPANTRMHGPGSANEHLSRVSRAYGKVDINAERRSGSQFTCSEEIEGLGGNVQKTYKTASTIVDWVNFDEAFLKPFFGGSRREYTPTSSDLNPSTT